jgi:hypothetical protein
MHPLAPGQIVQAVAWVTAILDFGFWILDFWAQVS